MSMIFGSSSLYQPPSWLGGVLPRVVPATKLSLGCFPTPMQQITSLQEFQEKGVDLWIKRDDLSSFDLSGNKVRKLEFLLADALQRLSDSVVTIGGVQSNHCKATAVAARQLGLQPHLILRTPSLPSPPSSPPSLSRPPDSGDELGVVGNLLFDRLVNAQLYTFSPGTYARIGSDALLRQLGEALQTEGARPYLIPVGGSNALGAFGYVECVREIEAFSTQHALPFDHIVAACGSGGTLAGLALGLRLSGNPAQLHCVGVCDSPQYFYRHLREVAEEWGVDCERLGGVESLCLLYDGQGAGYARSTEEEIRFLTRVSSTTGVVLDPVYSGKAFFYMVKKLLPSAVFAQGQRVLFIHTGGALGLYDKEQQLLPVLREFNQVQKLVVRLEEKKG